MGLNSLTLTKDIDILLSTTLARYQPEFADAVSTNIPYLFFLIDRGMKVVKAGGLDLRFPIHAADNSTFGSYAPYDTLDTTPQDNQLFSRWDWKNLAVSITIDGPSLRKNAGSDTQIINILATKIEEAEIAMREGISKQLLGSAGDSSNDITGLQTILSSSNSTGTVGNLSRVTNTFWRQQSQTAGNAFATNGLRRMTSLYNDCLFGTEKVNLIIFNQATFENYETTLTDNANVSDRFVVSSPFETIKGDAGMHVMRFKGVPVIFDDNVAANVGYFINTNTIKWCVQADADFATTDFFRGQQQDAKVAQILLMANQVCTNLKRNGVLLNTDTNS